jgi:class 3 adenylate cyclase
MWKFREGDNSSWSQPDFPDEDWKTQKVPGFWMDNDARHYSIAWYRAWLDLPAQMSAHGEWALALQQVFVAAEIYWNGQLLLRHGKVGDSKPAEKPAWEDHVYLIPPESSRPGRHLIAMRVSNHHWFSGGFGRAPEVGAYEVLFERHEMLKTWNGLLAGTFLLSGLYYLILFLHGRAQRENLLFALVAFAVTLLVVLFELPDVLSLNQHLLDLRTRLIWADMMATVVLMYWFLTAQFEYANCWLTRLVVGGSALMMAPMIVPVDITHFRALLPIRDRWFEATTLVGVYIIFWAVRKKKPGGRILAFGVLPLALGGIYSSLTFESVWALTGFALFVISMGVSLSKKMAGIEREVRRTRDVFRRFVPDQVLDKIAKEGLDSIKLGGAEEGIATILFTDIRSFTSIAEKLSPNETLAFLNGFMQRMQPVIHEHGGFINEFIGDEIMAIFYKFGQADAAIQTAIAMRQVLKAYNQERSAAGEPEIDVGVGINTGKVIWGTIGSEVRMDSAIIGDTVNLASRLQSLTRRYHAGVLVSDSTFREIQHPKKFCFREIDVVQVKGKSNSVVLYEFFEVDPEPHKTQKMQSLAEYTRGLQSYRARVWQRAASSFEACLKICPDDSIARMYLERCRAYLQSPPGADWNGVTVLVEK